VDIDKRGFRIALIADDLVNPTAGRFDAIQVLQEEGWGAIQLPPAWYPADVAAPLLEQIAEHVEEFARHGYQLVLLGDRPGLAEALDRIGAARPDSLDPRNDEQLREFLQARPPADPALARGEIA
jgi:hypothetical protein